MTGKRQKVKAMSPKQRAAAMINVRKQHGQRTQRAITMDARKTAQRVYDPDTDNLHPWQNRPNRCDVEGVDTRMVAKTPEKPEPEPKADVPTEEEFYRREYWQDPKTGLHPASGSGRLQINETPWMEVRTIGGEPIIVMYNPWTKEERHFSLDEKEKAKKEFKDLYKDTFGSQAKQKSTAPHVEPTGFQADPTLIDRDLAMRSHSGTSWSPEKRGEMEIQSFVEDVEHVRKTLVRSTESPEELAMVDREMDKFQKGYAQKWNARMAAHSSCFSSMIAGPSKFPARKAEKASKAYDKRTAETIEYKERAINAITRKLKDHRISAGGGEVAMMEKKLASAEADQTRMKAVNKILRSKKPSDDEKAKRVHEELGLSEQLIHLLMNPDWGKPGYPAYKLTNNNANIKRMKERVKEMQAREDTPTTEITFAGGTIIDSNEDDRVQIYYDDKPDDAMRSKLKGAGWHWSPSNGVWQRKRTPAAMMSAKQITGGN